MRYFLFKYCIRRESVKMKKKRFFSIIPICTCLALCLYYNHPDKKDVVSELAKRSIQARTFQIHEVKNTSYNIFSKKYKITLLNIETGKYADMYIWFDDKGERVAGKEVVYHE